MYYTIGEVAERLNLTPYTLRFYDKEGLLPFVERGAGGVRRFKEEDFGWLGIIECLKATGMPIKDIRTFIDWCAAGDSTLEARRAMFYERRRAVEAQMKELQKALETIEHKCRYYDAAVAAGTEAVVKGKAASVPASE